MCTSIFMFVAFISVVSSQGPSLKLTPDKPIHHAKLTESLYLECTPEVDDPTLVKDIQWIGPDGNQIVGRDRLTTEPLAGGGLGLFINNIEEGDTGDYKCTAVYAGNNNLEAPTRLEPYQGITFENAPKDQHATLGGQGEIICKVVANPPANVDWFKDGVLVSNTDRISIEPGKLRFTQTLTDDVGSYKCRAKVPDTGSLMTKLIQFDVYTPPEFLETIEPVNAIEGEEIQILCSAAGHPTPKYQWKSPQNADLSLTEGYTVENGKLIIHSVKREDKGDYTCTAENDAGEIDISASLSVVLKPKIEQFENITASVGETTRIVCRVSGEPIPKVTVRKASLEQPYFEGLQAGNERVSYIVNEVAGTAEAVVEITSIQRGDDGLYACQGTNVGGEVFQNGHIEVQFPPVFPEDQAPPMVWSWNNRIVNLSCIAEAIPNATIHWTKNNKNLEEDTHVTARYNKGASNLQVDPVDASYFGTYFCHATNNILPPPEPRRVVLKEAHVPGEILQVIFSKTTATTITFQFRGPVDTGGQDIDAYKVQYKETGEKWEEDAKIKSWPVEPYILENLVPKRTYNFRFAARNAVGYGEYAGHETKTMPEEGPPEIPEISTEGDAKDVVTVPFPDHYLLRWNVPANNGKPIQKYTINYYKINEETRQKAGDRVGLEVKPTELTYDLTGLRDDTFYKIELRAVNEIGNSEPGEITVKTAPDPSGDGSASGATEAARTTPGIIPEPDDLAKAEAEETTEGGLSTGIIVVICLLILIVVMIIVDLTLYFWKKEGVTHMLVSKAGRSRKEKLTSLEDGKAEKEPLANVTAINPVDSQDVENEKAQIISGKGEEDTKKLIEDDTKDVKIVPAKEGSKTSINKDAPDTAV